MEKKEEDKSGGEHVNFVYSIGVEEKVASFLCRFNKLSYTQIAIN